LNIQKLRISAVMEHAKIAFPEVVGNSVADLTVYDDPAYGREVLLVFTDGTQLSVCIGVKQTVEEGLPLSGYDSSRSERSISSQTMRTNSTLSRTCSRSGTVFELRYFACRKRNAAIRQAFSSHQSFGGWESPGEVMCSLI
jgi:hypothetical protein